MRNNRKKRRRQQRAIMKHQAASEALAEKIAVSVRKQKALTERNTVQRNGGKSLRKQNF